MTPERLNRLLHRRRSLGDVLGTGGQAQPSDGDGRDGSLRCVGCGGEIEPGLAVLASVSCHECRPARANHVLSR